MEEPQLRVLRKVRQTQRVHFDNLEKPSHFWGAAAGFAGLIAVFIIIGAVAPSVVKNDSANVVGLELIAINVSRYTANFTNLTPWNQRLWVEAALFRPSAGNTKFNKPELQYTQEYHILAEGFDEEGETPDVVSDTVHVKKITCHDEVGFCDSDTLYTRSFLDHKNYRVQLDFSNPSVIGETDFSLITAVNVYAAYINDSFMKYIAVLRYLLLAASLVTLGCFLRGVLAMRKAKVPLSWEQKWTLALICCSILLNNPLAALEYTQPGIGWSTFDVACVATFIALLITFWLTVLDSLRMRGDYKYRQVLARRNLEQDIDLPAIRLADTAKIILATLVWINVVLLYIWLEVNNKDDPDNSLHTGDDVFDLLLYISWILGIIYACWFVFLTGMVFRVRRHLTASEKFLTVTSFLVIITTLAGMFAGIYEPVPTGGITITMVLGAFNLYIWLLAFGYYPRKVDRSNDEVMSPRASLATDEQDVLEDDSAQAPEASAAYKASTVRRPLPSTSGTQAV